MSEPWGHKITLSVYVEGDGETAWDLANRLIEYDDERIGFMDAHIDPVQDHPGEEWA